MTAAAMPGLTITTDFHPQTAASRDVTTSPHRESASSPTESPSRPQISPITPTRESAQLPAHSPSATIPNTMPDFARDRPTFTHTTQTDQVGIEAPPAQPIDFESNPDVLA